MSPEYCNINSIALTNTMYSTSSIEMSFRSADTIPTTEYYFTKTITASSYAQHVSTALTNTMTTTEYYFTKTIMVTASNCAQDVSNTQTGIIIVLLILSIEHYYWDSYKCLGLFWCLVI